MAKILIAMSGGVDSSLVAALLVEQGHDVTGVTMHLWNDDDGRLAESLCCSQEMTASARRVCAQLGIPYYVFNYQKEFRQHVIAYFLKEYAQGYTPNPCLACNRDIKFSALLKRAEALGFDYVATGHYARIRGQGTGDRGQGLESNVAQPSDHQPRATDDSSNESIENRKSKIENRYELWRACDYDKDQSYMLYMLPQAQLARVLFPLGEYTKPQVRAMAAARGLASANRPESQDVCFVPGGDYRNLLLEEAPESIVAGPIFDQGGREVGRHKGLPFYTVGQRKGLGIAAAHALFVTQIDPARNALVVGPLAALDRRELDAADVRFVDEQWPAAPLRCHAQTRSHVEAVPAELVPLESGRARVVFDEPQRHISPGQAVVLYEGDRVLGGGRITS